MRFKLTLELTDKTKNVLPVNYQYELSGWIYKVIHQGNPLFSEWLHNNGFMNEKKQFRLFTFSRLSIPKLKLQDDRLIIQSPVMRVIISMLPPISMQNFITGIFADQEFVLGDSISQVPLKVVLIEALPEPVFNDTAIFNSLSPVIISHKGIQNRYAQYLVPGSPLYKELFQKNLNEKWLAYYKVPFQLKDPVPGFELLSEPKKNGVIIKAGTAEQSKIIGYSYKFRLSLPAELIRFGYYTGFGEKNSLGFGCGEMLT